VKIFAIIGMCFLPLFATLANAHSVDELNKDLFAREQYFQSIDQSAPGFELLDAEGKTVRLDDLRGKVVVLYFVYLNCPDICLPHTDRIVDIQNMINKTPMRDLVEFVTVTTDPKNDTFEIMKEFGPARGLDPYNWTFLTSGPDRLTATRALVEQFGHKFTKTEEAGYQLHGTVTHVIDMWGQWRGNFHSLGFEKINMVKFINALTNEKHREGEAEDRGIWKKILDAIF